MSAKSTTQFKLTTQQEIRDAFWFDHPEHARHYRREFRGANYSREVRDAFDAFVRVQAEAGHMSRSLFLRVEI